MYRSTTDSVRSSPARASFQPPECNQPQAIKLTAREKEVLQWSAIGKSSWEIAQIIDCTEAGVNYHFCNIRRKFGVRSRWIAMVMALEQGLIQSS
ncbi:Transcriptional activator protein LasR [compost metagenome]|jgi:DNA-binding CsgD family transcriptional regulator|uniref:Transcriptional activator protein LasR n=1 Tax=Pseudomonas fluorescens TaxID=294 RepID=A0A5E7RVM7_PSEFL|nr:MULTISPECIES: LuxR family transcriptional regulator [Pseudomonas]OPK11930.1 helix-turn-helix transcriptional regulator [Pseudomonas sp. VI4.1]QCY12711.1 LuxR family transcriptional regulator [Pseudomonas sp. MPC6]VVP77880.1 Transcriptional activator protein LasR [Pseudomonas fluorescens]